MTLRQKQSLFARLVAKLIPYIESKGYEVTFGEVWRPEWVARIYAGQFPMLTVDELRRLHPAKATELLAFQEDFARVAGRGTWPTNHNARLAIDLNLFRNGRWVTTIEHYEPFGLWWEQQHELARWGGRWHDAPHFSLRHKWGSRWIA